MGNHTFKVLLFFLGAFGGGILAIVLKHNQILSADFSGQWVGVAGAFVGLIIGNWIDNNRDAARVARELDEEHNR